MYLLRIYSAVGIFCNKGIINTNPANLVFVGKEMKNEDEIL